MSTDAKREGNKRYLSGQDEYKNQSSKRPPGGIKGNSKRKI